MEKIILASSSPRRSMLLRQAGIPFEVVASNYDESLSLAEEISPYDLVKLISTEKAMRVCETMNEPCIIIAADTIVSYLGKVMGKPSGPQEAYTMLNTLKGKSHSVYTGVTIIRKTDNGMELKNIVDTTKVNMRKLTEEEISHYIGTGEPFDKAGAYAIQEKGLLLIESIEGDYYNVVGLPLVKVYQALKDFGIDLTRVWQETEHA